MFFSTTGTLRDDARQEKYEERWLSSEFDWKKYYLPRLLLVVAPGLCLHFLVGWKSILARWLWCWFALAAGYILAGMLSLFTSRSVFWHYNKLNSEKEAKKLYWDFHERRVTWIVLLYFTTLLVPLDALAGHAYGLAEPTSSSLQVFGGCYFLSIPWCPSFWLQSCR